MALRTVGQEERGTSSSWQQQLSLRHSPHASSFTFATWSSQSPCQGGRIIIPLTDGETEVSRSWGTCLSLTASTWQSLISHQASSSSKTISSLSHCSLQRGLRRKVSGPSLLNWGLRTIAPGSVQGTCLKSVFLSNFGEGIHLCYWQFCYMHAKAKKNHNSMSLCQPASLQYSAFVVFPFVKESLTYRICPHKDWEIWCCVSQRESQAVARSFCEVTTASLVPCCPCQSTEQVPGSLQFVFGKEIHNLESLIT